jgi:hypothetical protein
MGSENASVWPESDRGAGIHCVKRAAVDELEEPEDDLNSILQELEKE